MASKLFHAVVAVGLSLGAACGGSVERDADPDPTPEDAGTPLPDAATSPPDAGVAPETGVVPDASIAPDAPAPDAGTPDAPKDAIVQAFCDVTWPITKAGREVCGPYDDCINLEAPFCYGPDAEGACALFPLECVDKKWQCMAGTPTSQGFPPPEPCK